MITYGDDGYSMQQQSHQMQNYHDYDSMQMMRPTPHYPKHDMMMQQSYHHDGFNYHNNHNNMYHHQSGYNGHSGHNGGMYMSQQASMGGGSHKLQHLNSHSNGHSDSMMMSSSSSSEYGRPGPMKTHMGGGYQYNHQSMNSAPGHQEMSWISKGL